MGEVPAIVSHTHSPDTRTHAHPCTPVATFNATRCCLMRHRILADIVSIISSITSKAPERQATVRQHRQTKTHEKSPNSFPTRLKKFAQRLPSKGLEAKGHSPEWFAMKGGLNQAALNCHRDYSRVSAESEHRKSETPHHRLTVQHLVKMAMNHQSILASCSAAPLECHSLP